MFGDNLVLFLLLICLIYIIVRPWLPFSLREWWFSPKKKKEPEPLQGAIPDILRENGYEPVQEKIKSTIYIDVDEEEYESRLFFDYIAEKDQQYYLVITARDRKPVRWSGAGLRDFFLASYLAVKPAAILYVLPEKRLIKTIEIELENLPSTGNKKSPFPIGILLSFLTGMIVMLLLLQ